MMTGLKARKNGLHGSKNSITEYVRWLCNGIEQGWLGRAYRYTLEDMYGKKHFPEKVKAGLIPMSVCAKKKLDNHNVTRKHSYSFYTKHDLRYEHMVPLKEIKRQIEKSNYCQQSTEKILLECFQIAWITSYEDQRLREMGLNSSMPKGWKLGDSPNARYEAAGIVLVE